MSDYIKNAKLRNAWIAVGDPPCPHPHVSREASSGDLVCQTCGRDFTRREWEAMQVGDAG